MKWYRGVWVPGAFKLGHLLQVEPLLILNVLNFFTFILGRLILLTILDVPTPYCTRRSRPYSPYNASHQPWHPRSFWRFLLNDLDELVRLVEYRGCHSLRATPRNMCAFRRQAPLKRTPIDCETVQIGSAREVQVQPVVSLSMDLCLSSNGPYLNDVYVH